MLSKSLTRSYYLSLYERCVRWAHEERVTAAKIRAEGGNYSADVHDLTANEYAQKATQAMQDLATLR